MGPSSECRKVLEPYCRSPKVVGVRARLHIVDSQEQDAKSCQSERELDLAAPKFCNVFHDCIKGGDLEVANPS